MLVLAVVVCAAAYYPSYQLPYTLPSSSVGRRRVGGASCLYRTRGGAQIQPSSRVFSTPNEDGSTSDDVEPGYAAVVIITLLFLALNVGTLPGEWHLGGFLHQHPKLDTSLFLDS